MSCGWNMKYIFDQFTWSYIGFSGKVYNYVEKNL